MGMHAHATCPVCSSRITRKFATRGSLLARRWGYLLESVPGQRGKIRKLDDIPLRGMTPKTVTGWLGPVAELLAARVALALADLIHAGWELPDLRANAGHLVKQAVVAAAVPAALARSEPSPAVGQTAGPHPATIRTVDAGALLRAAAGRPGSREAT